jgi:chaperone required for assembly of F1-ATPase
MSGSDEIAPRGAKGAALKAALPKRFYKDVTVKDEEGGWGSLLLDGKPMRTPGKAAFTLPVRALAEAVASEWRAQGEHIDPSTMPLTRLANSAIDGVAGREQAVIDDIARHAASDLLCYRAEGPNALVEAQSAHWDPVLAFGRDELKAPLVLSEGVVHVAQPQASLARIRGEFEGLDPFSLAALHVMTALTGSALLALAVLRGKLTPEQAWRAAHVDEDFQISQWGEDAEAKTRRENRWRDFAAAAKLLDTVR